jgi:hypothetical protein
LKRAYAKRQDSHKPEPAQPPVPIVASGREIQLSLDRDELLGLRGTGPYRRSSRPWRNPPEHDRLESSAAARENGRGDQPSRPDNGRDTGGSQRWGVGSQVYSRGDADVRPAEPGRLGDLPSPTPHSFRPVRASAQAPCSPAGTESLRPLSKVPRGLFRNGPADYIG